MKRYVLARVSARPCLPDAPCAATAAPDIVELSEVDRYAFFRRCFYIARNVARPQHH